MNIALIGNLEGFNMDIISHGVLGGYFTRKYSLFFGILFGILPDAIGWLGRQFFDGSWEVYHASHSLFAVILVFLLSWYALRTIIYGTPYLAHVMIDVLSHGTGTGSLFYPFKDPIGFQGWNWWESYGLLIEVGGWLVILLLWYFSKEK